MTTIHPITPDSEIPWPCWLLHKTTGWHFFEKGHRANNDLLMDCGYTHYSANAPTDKPGEVEESLEIFSQQESRRMSAAFLTLPLHRKIEVARSFNLYCDGDASLSDVEMARAFFKRAVDQKKARQLFAALVSPDPVPASPTAPARDLCAEAAREIGENFTLAYTKHGFVLAQDAFAAIIRRVVEGPDDYLAACADNAALRARLETVEKERDEAQERVACLEEYRHQATIAVRVASLRPNGGFATEAAIAHHAQAELRLLVHDLRAQLAAATALAAKHEQDAKRLVEDLVKARFDDDQLGASDFAPEGYDELPEEQRKIADEMWRMGHSGMKTAIIRWLEDRPRRHAE